MSTLLLLSPILLIVGISFNPAFATTPIEDSEKAEQHVSLPFFLPYSHAQSPNLAGDLAGILYGGGLDNINIEPADYWQVYLNAIRVGRPGIYLAAPHFASWLVQQHDFKPIARFSEPLSYHLVTRQDDFWNFEVGDLAGKNVCTDHALNLDFLMLSDLFKERRGSAIKAVTWSLETRFKEDDPRCSAFVVPDNLLNKMVRKRPGYYVQLAATESFSHFALLTHPDISDAVVSQLADVVASEDAIQLISEINSAIEANAKIEPATKADYPRSYTQALDRYWR
ncbi:MAG: hypothetical protein AAF197_02785 [Pseudomonadota bacterium]